MRRSFDVIIAGLGAMGSAAAYYLARRGRRVLGLDRYAPPHALGSSHGQSRIIREAYFEHPLYVPLVQRAYELWAELEQEAGRPLVRQTGGVMIGPPDGMLVSGSQRSARVHCLPHETLSAVDLRRRFPALEPGGDMIGVWEPRAGVLFPEACVGAQLEMARRQGAQLKFDEPVERWQIDGDGIRVITDRQEHCGAQLLLCAGPWVRGLCSDLALPLTVERQVLFWFEPAAHAERFDPARCPIYGFEYMPGCMFYGFPDLGTGVKVARHHEGEITDPERVRRSVDAEEIAAIRPLLQRFVPDANGPLRSAAVCMYTNMPDSHFLIDFHPAHRQVLIASPCSGHGFKFAPAIGEVLADLLTAGHSRFDLDPFRIRFG